MTENFFLDFPVSAEVLFKFTEHFAHEEGTCLLYSGSAYETAQHSYLMLFPFETIRIQTAMQVRCQLNKPPLILQEVNPWNAMQNLGSDFGQGSSIFPEWTGFFSYEMGAFSDPDVVIPHSQGNDLEAYWQRCALTLLVDHATSKGEVKISKHAKNSLPEHHKQSLKDLSKSEGWKNLLNNKCTNKKHSKLILNAISETKESYLQKIEYAKEFIKSGDIYQINLSQQWDFLGKRDPFTLFQRLASLNPAPFSAYLYLKDFAVVSSSPERFLQKKGQILETRPIKGTAPRGTTLEEDLINQQILLNSEKERAELMMITDLMRNDLGKISEIGSVNVPLLCGCETYQNVFHLHSVIQSKAWPTLHPLEIVRSCFPGGSITGCPKLRAMELIAQIEQRRRGLYTGSIGYFTGNGDFDLNIAIRTMIVTENHVKVQLGGGIVIDSDPVKEYEETYHKGRSIFEVLQSE